VSVRHLFQQSFKKEARGKEGEGEIREGKRKARRCESSHRDIERERVSRVNGHIKKKKTSASRRQWCNSIDFIHSNCTYYFILHNPTPSSLSVVTLLPHAFLSAWPLSSSPLPPCTPHPPPLPPGPKQQLASTTSSSSLRAGPRPSTWHGGGGKLCKGQRPRHPGRSSTPNHH